MQIVSYLCKVKSMYVMHDHIDVSIDDVVFTLTMVVFKNKSVRGKSTLVLLWLLLLNFFTFFAS